MKARLVPLWLTAADDPDFAAQTARVRELLGDVADVLEPLPLGAPLPDADAAVFPQMLGAAYRLLGRLQGALAAAARAHLRVRHDVDVGLGALALPPRRGRRDARPVLARDGAKICRALAAKRELREGQFVVYQDEPGVGGFQPSIFKRFYWWEDECAERMRDAFGLGIVRKSFARARRAGEGDRRRRRPRGVGAPPRRNTGRRCRSGRCSARSKLYLALSDDLDAEHAILAAGINCLNESAFSDTTPCLAWNLLHRDKRPHLGLRGDVVSMLTTYVLHRSLRAPTMMTNLYPFLMGQAALRHERIPAFPEVERPEDHVLAAHCGYFGLMPRSFASEWTLRPPGARDRRRERDTRSTPASRSARSPCRSSTRRSQRLVVAEGELTGYEGYPGSDCRNGGVIRVRDGHALMRRVPSHHSLLTVGHDPAGLDTIGAVFGLEVERI